MTATKQELSLLINPIVPEAVQHNNRVRPPFPPRCHLQPMAAKPQTPLTSLHPFREPNHPFKLQTPNSQNQTNNKKILTSLHSLTAFLLGLSAGILALQSTTGFAFYFAGTILVSALFHAILYYRSGGVGAGAFFPGNGGEIEGGIGVERGVVWMERKGKGFLLRKGAWRDVWFGGGVLSEALSGFVLGWAGVGGVLR